MIDEPYTFEKHLLGLLRERLTREQRDYDFSDWAKFIGDKPFAVILAMTLDEVYQFTYARLWLKDREEADPVPAVEEVPDLVFDRDFLPDDRVEAYGIKPDEEVETKWDKPNVGEGNVWGGVDEPEEEATSQSNKAKPFVLGAEERTDRVFEDGEAALRVNPVLEASKLSGFNKTKKQIKKDIAERAFASAGGVRADPEAMKSHLAAVEKIRAAAGDPMKQKWEAAEAVAVRPREQWEGKLDIEMDLMVNYIYGWLKETGEVPKRPGNLLELYRPVPSFLENNEKSNERRGFMVGRVIDFWRKSIEAKGSDIDLHSKSYRVTMASMKLEKELERYASNYRGIGQANYLPDETLAGFIKDAALQYFKAHFPIENLGVKPGPLQTLDPNYIEYRALCKKYALKVGCYLHEENL